MPTKVMRYQIIKPIDGDWSLLGNVLRELQRESRTIANKTIQYCWEWQGFSSEYKEKNNVYPKDKEVLAKTLSGYCYSRLASEYYKSQTGNLSATLDKVFKKWKSDKIDILKGEKSIPSFRKDIPIDLKKDNISIYKIDTGYVFKLSLLSQKYRKELDLNKGQFEILINEGDKSSRDILNRCISGEYKISSSQLLNKKNKWFINLAYTFDSNVKELDPTNRLGIDMGVVYPVYMAVYNSPVRGKIDGGEIDRFRKQVFKRNKQLQIQGKYCGEGRVGHGIKTRIKPTEFAKEKIANFKDTINHKYSRHIIDFAIKNNCDTIVMEDLTGITQGKKPMFLKNWTYYDLQQKIKYKAEEKGLFVELIDPQYTSQRCSKCGFIDKENRPEQEVFKCLNCDNELNADYNAALNISTPDIENLIQGML